MKIVGVITARMTSTRLPGKCLLDLGRKPVIDHHVERMKLVKGIDEIYIATSKSPENKPLHDAAKRLGVKIYAGEDEDIVERYVSIGDISSADALVRIGCDKPFFCYELLQKNIDNYNGEDFIYFKKGMPMGVAHELLSLKALKEVHKHYRGTAISQYIREHPHEFNIRSVMPDSLYRRPEYRLALDTPEDYQLAKKICQDIAFGGVIATKEVLLYLDDNPEIAKINSNFEEKNVNLYCSKLDQEPVFKIYLDDDGKYIIVDRVNKNIKYNNFLSHVSNKNKWRME